MACVKSTGYPGRTLTTSSTTLDFEPMTPWMPAVGLATTDFVLSITGLSGSIRIKPGYQLAVVRTDKPDAPAAISSGSYATVNGQQHWQETFTATAKMFVRFGAMYDHSTGTGLGRADVTMTLATKSCGKLLGTSRVVIGPGAAIAIDTFYPITPWYPAIGLSKAMAAFIVMQQADASTFKYQLAIRTAVDKMDPGDWVPLLTTWNTPTGNEERNSGEVLLTAADPAIASSMYVQFALAWQGTTTTSQGIVHTSVGVTHT